MIGTRRSAEFRKLLEEKGLFQEEWFLLGKMDASSGYEMTMSIPNLPDGIFISDPDTAQGVFLALRERKSNAETVVYNNFFPVHLDRGVELRIFSKDVWQTALSMIARKAKGEREQGLSVSCPARLLENTASKKQGV